MKHIIFICTSLFFASSALHAAAPAPKPQEQLDVIPPIPVLPKDMAQKCLQQSAQDLQTFLQTAHAQQEMIPIHRAYCAMLQKNATYWQTHRQLETLKSKNVVAAVINAKHQELDKLQKEADILSNRHCNLTVAMHHASAEKIWSLFCFTEKQREYIHSQAIILASEKDALEQREQQMTAQLAQQDKQLVELARHNQLLQSMLQQPPEAPQIEGLPGLLPQVPGGVQRRITRRGSF